MSGNLTPGTGTRIFIGDKAWDHSTLAAYDGASGWLEIGQVETVPEFGTKWEGGSFTPLATGLKQKYKTTRDNGSLTLSAAKVGDDAGQVAAALAVDDATHSYPIMITLNDKPAGAGAKPTRFFFRANVMSATVATGSTSDVVKTNIALEITSEIVEGAAQAGTP